MTDDRDDLEERVEELEATLRELRDEFGRPPRGPMGLPRPPTPGELLRFTGEYGIPTAIAVLEANVRALEMLQRVIRLVDPERDTAADAADQARDELGSRAQRASRATLDRLDAALADLDEALTEGDLPREPTARRLLDEARRLNDDIREEVSAGRERADAGRETTASIDAESTESDRADQRLGDDAVDIAVREESDEDENGEDDRPEVDVDAELRSIRKELGERDPDGSEESDDENDEDANRDAGGDDGNDTGDRHGDDEDADAGI
ncbi:DUF7547 family protein [Halomicrococcus sp. NG-SE-24]|uniref:DUF7547 family protein n=1 Tax=Halomicrococcus sp. NG-SE-24 TaxID=3436928 RepID=UPI003D9843FA